MEILGRVKRGTVNARMDMRGHRACGNRIVGTRELTDVINLAIRLSAHERKSLGEIVRVRLGRPGLRTLGDWAIFFCNQLLLTCVVLAAVVLAIFVSVVAIRTSAENTIRSKLPIVISERIQNKTSWVMGERRGFSDDCVLRRVIAPFFISRR